MLSLCFSRLDSSVSRLSRSLARSAFLSRDSGGENTFTRLPLSDSRFDPSIHSCSRFQEIESDSLITVFTAEKGKRREERGEAMIFPSFLHRQREHSFAFPFPLKWKEMGRRRRLMPLLLLPKLRHMSLNTCP